MNNEIKNSLFYLNTLYHQYKLLFEYWQQNNSMRSQDEIRERIDYIQKNGIKQKNEIETLLWVLNDGGNDEQFNNQTKNII